MELPVNSNFLINYFKSLNYQPIFCNDEAKRTTEQRLFKTHHNLLALLNVLQISCTDAFIQLIFLMNSFRYEREKIKIKLVFVNFF